MQDRKKEKRLLNVLLSRWITQFYLNRRYFQKTIRIAHFTNHATMPESEVKRCTVHCISILPSAATVTYRVLDVVREVGTIVKG